MIQNTKKLIFEAAYELCKAEYGAIAKLTRKAIARKVGVTAPLVTYHWDAGLVELRKAIIEEARVREDWHIINSAVGIGEPTALELPREIRERAAIEVLG